MERDAPRRSRDNILMAIRWCTDGGWYLLPTIWVDHYYSNEDGGEIVELYVSINWLKLEIRIV